MLSTARQTDISRTQSNLWLPVQGMLALQHGRFIYQAAQLVDIMATVSSVTSGKYSGSPPAHLSLPRGKSWRAAMASILGRVHTNRSASTMSAKERKARKTTSSFSKREKMRRKPLSRRNSRSISLRFL